MHYPLTRTRSWLAASGAGVVLLLAACSSTPLPAPPAPSAATPAAPPLAPSQAQAPAPPATTSSVAANPRDYRRDAATHLYRLNAAQIFQGKMPPLLYAIGVLQVEIDGKGRVTATNWMRPPRHAPEVIAEIERMVRRAAPYPAPARMGRVTYTDTWLWHVSGRFQLDTLTEGQL